MITGDQQEPTDIPWVKILIFSLFIGAAIGGSFYFIDLPVAIAIRTLDVQIVGFFQVITGLGNAAWYLVPAALLFMLFHYVWNKEQWARRCLFVFSAVAVSGLTTDLLKWIAGRWRPKAHIQDQLYGFDFFGVGYEATSFPSGHATTVWAFCMTMTVLFPRYRLAWYVLAILVSISRIIVSAHYLSDIFAGAYVAVITVILLKEHRYFRLKHVPGQGIHQA